MTSAAIGSAHDQPNRLLSSNPTCGTADKYVHNKVCLGSATAEAEPSSRPVRRCAVESTGMMTRLAAANPIPIGECWASPIPARARIESTVTYSARAKKENAMIRSAIFSRFSGSRPANCHATAAAEDTSITESSPNPISAVEDTRVPSVKAMAASMTL